jgi:hypothetical protein
MRITPQHLLREAVVLIAYDDRKPVGTMTVTQDSPAGLPLDHDYPVELTALRRVGARLSEFGSLAVEKHVRGAGVTLLLNMAAHFVARNIMRSTHSVIGVNPNAEGFYSALYDFRRLAEPRAHAELAAPVLGLVHECQRLGDFLSRHFVKPMESGRAVWEHYSVELPGCVVLQPEILHGDLRLPRAVFREVFVHRSGKLQSLDAATRRYLDQQRGPDTVRPPSDDSAAIFLSAEGAE